MDATKPSKSRLSRVSKESRPLKRGKACKNCRYLKIKCDGTKPICGPCEHHPSRRDDCEYDGAGKSRTKVLEDTVSRLEARLLELEKPPYQTSTTPSLPSGWHSALEAKLANTESTCSSGSSSSCQVPVPFLGVEEPSLGFLKSSLDKFLPLAKEFGFFLHIDTFRLFALLPLGDPNRPTPGLLHTVHLFGTHLESMHAQEAPLLTCAEQFVAIDLIGSESHPDKIIHTLQAEVLLAYYFLCAGLLLQAKHHTGAAVSLSLRLPVPVGAGFSSASNIMTPLMIRFVQYQPYPLPPPRNDLQEAERINGYLAVLNLQNFVNLHELTSRY